MSLAARMFATASSLLTRYGQTISVVRDNGTFNASTGTMDGTSTTSYDGVGYPSNYSKRDIDGVVVIQSDTLLIFSSNTPPIVNDVFTVGAKVMTALDVQIITVSGQDVLYKVQLRQ